MWTDPGVTGGSGFLPEVGFATARRGGADHEVWLHELLGGKLVDLDRGEVFNFGLEECDDFRREGSSHDELQLLWFVSVLPDFIILS